MTAAKLLRVVCRLHNPVTEVKCLQVAELFTCDFEIFIMAEGLCRSGSF